MIGFLNVYKPKGLTSFDVIRKIKKEVKPHKIGHLGTLDPMAEGILPIAIGHGTRLIEFIQDKSKTYYAKMLLGGTSDTQDQWGAITFSSDKTRRFSKEEIERVFTQFRGDIRQIPPMYSAVHHNGQRLYELARKGMTVEREARDAYISRLELLDVRIQESGQQEITFQVKCSEGTYIRTLCHDMGQMLGNGAYMTCLVREKWGGFTLDNAISLETAIQEWQDHIIDPLHVLQDLPVWTIPDPDSLQSIRFGNSIPKPENFPAGDKVILITENRDIAAIAGTQTGKKSKWEIRPYKVFK